MVFQYQTELLIVLQWRIGIYRLKGGFIMESEQLIDEEVIRIRLNELTKEALIELLNKLA